MLAKVSWLKIETEPGGLVSLTSPYNPEAARDLKAIGCKWNADDSVWQGNGAIVLARLKALCIKHWGFDPTQEQDVVDLHIDISGQEFSAETLYLMGRPLVRAFQGAGNRCQPGAELVSGTLDSTVNLQVGTAAPGTTLIVREVPRAAFGKLPIYLYPKNTIELVRDTSSPLVVHGMKMRVAKKKKPVHAPLPIPTASTFGHSATEYELAMAVAVVLKEHVNNLNDEEKDKIFKFIFD